MHVCAYCGRRLPLFHRVAGSLRFCSKEHARLHALLTEAALVEGELPGEAPPAENGPVETGPKDVRAHANPHDSGGAVEQRGDCPAWEGAPADLSDVELIGQLPAEIPAGPVASMPAPEPATAGSVSRAEPLLASPAEEPPAPAPAELLPLEMPPQLRGSDMAVRAMAHRPPRRRIIVPTHRPAPALRQLGKAGHLPESLRPAAPPFAGRQPALRPLSPALRTAVPVSPCLIRSGARPASPLRGLLSPAPRPIQHLARIGDQCLPPPDQPPESQPQPTRSEGLAIAPQMTVTRSRKHGPVVSPGLGKPALPQLTQGEVKPSLSGLLNGSIQPFRLHRPPVRPFRLPPGLPVKAGRTTVAPLGVRSAAFEFLFVPRVASMPLRPTYAIDPALAEGSPPAARSGLTAARTGPGRPRASLTGE